MLDLLGPDTVAGYCTNVHAGLTCDEVLANLDCYTLAVKQRVSPNRPMGVGLWLGAQTARQLVNEKRIDELALWLSRRGLFVFTLNGFPYGNFHQESVKHQVYQPDWRDPRRLAYTIDLVTVLSGLLAKGTGPLLLNERGTRPVEGSISTLPVAWRGESGRAVDGVATAARHLLQAVDHLARLEQETGQLIHVDLEPEPGCVLQTSQDVVDFFAHHLDPIGHPPRTRRYLRVCYDTCHGAVMFEPCGNMLRRYRRAEIQIGKVQVSSAISADLDKRNHADHHACLNQLKAFQEDRYLHQTVIQTTNPEGKETRLFYEDLPAAIASCRRGTPPAERWRVHFHVPLFLDRIGQLETTNRLALNDLAQITARTHVRHFEIETYAWGVLPGHVTNTDLATGIAQEFAWLTRHATDGSRA